MILEFKNFSTCIRIKHHFTQSIRSPLKANHSSTLQDDSVSQTSIDQISFYAMIAKQRGFYLFIYLSTYEITMFNT